MAVLAMNPGLSAAEVAQRTAMDKVAVSRAVALAPASTRRIARQLARRDRRRSLLRLAPAGQRVYAQVVPFALAYERELLAPLTERDRAALDRALRSCSAEPRKSAPRTPNDRSLREDAPSAMATRCAAHATTGAFALMPSVPRRVANGHV